MCPYLASHRLVPRSRAAKTWPHCTSACAVRVRALQSGSALDLMNSITARAGRPLASGRRLASFGTDRAAQVCESSLPGVLRESCRIAEPHLMAIRVDPCHHLRVPHEEKLRWPDISPTRSRRRLPLVNCAALRTETAYKDMRAATSHPGKPHFSKVRCSRGAKRPSVETHLAMGLSFGVHMPPRGTTISIGA